MKIWLAVGVAVLATGCGGSSDEPDKKPKPFEMSGKVVLKTTSLTTAGEGCMGGGGYDDLRAGADVVVTNATGERVALGELETGGMGVNGECIFAFDVPDVPGGGKIYSVEVANRGDVSMSRKEAEQLVTLTIGD